ncbi:tRNA (N(6)-L-threonylcarbamoyladenosine(37)-C(2))-methylthiotransferase MtaB [Chlamydiifrater phoenicopteri]|uniref:tRNA (N(6)-L-threonylcarbamoyladenosine(37)-C(2))- methylthiotransferase MtaB n=1 Tax=Chlamydiifrater phoenicopteri TaxID=2681469 RepID=UPI001BCDB1EE|nr:tRNA (N(6)-L-threonylcarbamoyladenosine(37)-C(2))-methylthiotransferase MtaB [Chlamydiifrater phoenicopteri]
MTIIDRHIAENKTFKLVYLGCRVNQYEVQAYRDQLTVLGYREVKDNEESADVCIVNTCAVTGSAESSSRRAIRQLIRRNPKARVFVTGCFADADKDFFRNLGESCVLVPNKEKHLLVEKIVPYAEELPEFAIKRFEDRSRAFIKVQDGCNSFCSYCIIPYLRGRSTSRPLSAVIKEIKGVVEQGYKEVVIAGINVGDYKDEDKSLADLIRAVDAIEGIERIRISSIDPEDVNEDLREAVLSGRATCPSFHLVLQSGSNAILKRMNRKYNRQDYLECVESLRACNPEFSFTTDIIVGFPGESESDFLDTIKVVETVGFVKVHVFPFSARRRTKAYEFSGTLSPEIIGERKRRLSEFSDSVAFSLRKKRIGSKVSVLVESIHGNQAFGHSEFFEGVWFPHEGRSFVNDMVEVQVTGNSIDGLFGERVG